MLAFVREYRSADAGTGEGEDGEGSATDRMLCVNNLSRYPQPVELDLSRFAGSVPVETMGGVAFPPIGELSYLLTLPGHGFYWLMLKPPANYGP